MAAATKTLWCAEWIVNEMALADAEPIPGVHFDRQDSNQGLNQPGPQRNPWGSGNTSPTAERRHGVVNSDWLLPHNDPTQGSLAGFPIGRVWS